MLSTAVKHEAGALRHRAALLLPLPPLPTFIVGGFIGLRNRKDLRVPVIVDQTIPAFSPRPSCSFDHLVGAGEEGGRDGDAESMSGFEVDHKLKMGRTLDRQL